VFVQKIEISGFKSFAKKTILDFNGSKKIQNGITCVVGPNGSGKSNISDALKWVIGEKSIKNLRGSRGEDVIFAGSASKAKLGCAQVSVFFDNSKKIFDLDFNQVVITRKIYRDGENNYYVNNNKVRLLDLMTILSKVGINQGNYTIVNQGMTDQILISSPLERMSFLEDAAGVKEFQIKKNQSLKRIKKTEVNLEKVASLMREIEPELRISKNQARKIEKSQVTREKLAEKRKQYFSFKLNKIKKTQEKNSLELERAEREIALSQNKIKDFQKNLEKSDKKSIENKDKIVERLENEKEKLEKELKNQERLDFKKEIQKKSLQEKIRELNEVKIILVDKKYILSNLEVLKKELTENLGKKLNNKIILKIEKLLKEIELGKVTRESVSEEKEKQKQVVQDELNSLEKKKDENSKQIEKIEKEVREKVSEIREINREKSEAQEGRLEFKDKLRREQFEIEKAEKYKQHLEIEQGRVEKDQAELEKDIQNNFQIKLEELEKNFSKNKNKTEEELKIEIEKLNWQLDQVKEIDVAVIEEYKELQTRYNFLKNESKDLSLTLKELKEIVFKMDKIIENKIMEAFSAIDKEFSIYFKLLFGGGQARLEKIKITKNKNLEEDDLEEEDQDVQHGIEVKLNPPGKKIESLNMLSGGERTLTSIALLFALIAYNPPPFVFLDEIEANLDESNAGNFSRILKKLADKTQFILATHSREVMRMADILYGITMNKKDAYSKIFSVELNQIKKNSKIIK
jgi:chromosome segregation protein